jgi:hypothetical protein
MLYQPVPGKYEVIAVAFSERCEHQTMLLGEDCFELKKIERAVKHLTDRLHRILPKLDSEQARRSIGEVSEQLRVVLEDACFADLMEDAYDAFDEAHVRLIRRAVFMAHPQPQPENCAHVCPLCGEDMNELNTSKIARDRGDTSCDRCEMIREREEAEANSQFGVGA